jgi:hypothetical protein
VCQRHDTGDPVSKTIDQLRLYDRGAKDRCRRMFNMPALGGRRPTELLADMLQLCPCKDKDTVIFRYLFLFRLPTTIQTIQTMLGEDETSVAELAARADALVDAAAGKNDTVAAAVEELIATGAATSSSRKRMQDGQKGGAGGTSDDPGPWQDLGLCWAHYQFGKKAKKCRLPCIMAGN